MDAINCLATILQSPSPSQSMTGSSTGIPLSHVRTPISRSPSTRSSVPSNLDSSISSLPRSASSASSLSSDLAPYVPTQSYLEVCINTGEYTKTLSEIDLRDVGCDGELFRRIRSEYRRLRGFRSRFWLLKPSGVHFVRVSKSASSPQHQFSNSLFRSLQSKIPLLLVSFKNRSPFRHRAKST